ncbi:hypothetical protein [Helicobacter sp. MIT 05-5294]|uniref:hypothetical protein n=1 Tax=Helicobacter sp. MIT 05-5294 TaxID=1548150 RepID=UPI00051FEFF2|nr:hypothetical protein [Helicobacter sp. MIT 05-5294]TLD85750.1 hypothetical protein LS69_008105 [Helicobacter sp. MIT 05-5294]
MTTRKRYKFITHYEKNNNQIYRFFHYNASEFVEDFLMNLGYDKYSHDDVDLLMFLQVPNITKADILELFEYSILCMIWAVKTETDEIIINTYMIDKHDEEFSTSCPKPTYISEYFNVIGELFLAGYIDFGCDWDDDYKRRDYPTNLSYYKEDKYQAWIYFRDHFLYKEAYAKGWEDDIFIYEDKEYTEKDCPRGTYIDEEGKEVACYKGYSTMYSRTSWDTPKYWSQYNIWATITPKGKRYLYDILQPRIHDKYKDLEVEVDNKGHILRWFGQINR